MAIIEAYMDEGGTHSGSPILAVAAVFGTHTQWSTYLGRWPHAAFHSVSSSESRKEELCSAIEEAGLSGVEVCLRPHEFSQLAAPELKSTLGNAYATAAFICAIRICRVACEDDPDGRVAVVLEDGQPNVEHVRRMLLQMMSEYPIASVTVAKKEDFTQLHAADFLAHSRATTAKQWMDRLFATDRFWEQKMERDAIENTSKEMIKVIKKNRNDKAKLRRERRSNNE